MIRERPWAIAQGFESEANVALRRLHAMRYHEKSMGAVWLDEAQPCDLYDVEGGIALIGVCGLLVSDLPVSGCDFATGYNCIRLAAGCALADPAVKAVALVIDSGGGMVSGCFELVEWLRAASIVSDKPITSIVKDCAASAAYAVACAAETISAPRTGAVGSIGVVRMHVDISGMLDQSGQTVTLIAAGSHKVDGNPYEPLPRSVKAEWQTEVESYRRLFAETVAARRMTVEAVLATEAALFEGPVRMNEALNIGLVDALAAPDDALAALIAAVSAY